MSHSEKKLASTRFTAAVPGALTAVLLVGAVAFGANSLRPNADAGSGERAASEKPAAAAPKSEKSVAGQPRDEVAFEPFVSEPEKPAATEKPKPTEEAKPPKEETKPTEEPKSEPTQKPQPVETKKPAPTPKPAPEQPTALVLEAWAKDVKIKLAWKPFTGDGFEYYKVVRSTDGNATWPAGGDDVVIGVIGNAGETWYADVPPCGTAWTYRVFAVRHGDHGYVTLAATNPASATLACQPQPTPVEVTAIAFELHAVAGEGVLLEWGACERDGFKAYKVVRSLTNADPRYPENDGTELIGVIGDPWETTFFDGDVTAGETWNYRVVAVTDGGGHYVPLCQTAALAATAQ